MIRVLPPEVVNQIAAGEVVERPFSVVKELVENALDAGATKVAVEITDGGKESIRITDDGAGFAPEDLALAFVSHATSKLAALRDLDHIASLGFRGEALASIGSVARCAIRSRRHDADSGHEIWCDGGALGEVRPCGVPPGTVVEVRDLFHNTPARRRFLRTARAERARIQDLLARLALARLDVDFTLVAEGREVLRLPAGESLRDRARRALGKAVADDLIAVELAWDTYRVQGLIGAPDRTRRDSTLSLLWINGRLARDRGAQQAVRQAYREYLMHGQHPVYVLMLALPPDEVDVNVHPTKSEVRFLDARRACGLLHEVVRNGLRAGGATPRVASVAPGQSGARPAPRTGFPELPRDLFGRADRARSDVPSRSGAFATVGLGAAEAVREPVPEAPGDAVRDARLAELAERRFLRAMDVYLVFETDDGLTVVDQHALHERVIYERLRRRHDARAEPLVQRLLVPDVVELSAIDKAFLLDHAGELAQEGFLVEDFGGPAVAIQGVPAVLGRASPRAVVESFLKGDDEDDARPRARDAVVERFHSMACRAAVMAGDRLRDEEIRALLAEASRLEHPHNCPHGRPTVLTFAAAELDRFFRRRV